ncbi:DNA polymerase delta, subunit 4-domain-containing protein [Rhodofomes roseus]|uniref:DNA polymerase delta, subunit 4-domain-containing protein n=1 Tax=Rhodofomes roseus TaxID=34475 RepID=A0ABQ8K6P9_9APHY|nr:DNA polymerase delta, subunit 4-domain-containing protein [Rhodofomes roseus]KAH9832550.1 DNA polymerase delta, subunit 4-domain-containing protein [Rhodofomes roseus]
MPTKRSTPMKQGTLAFTAGRRTATTGSKGKVSRPTTKRTLSSSAEPTIPDVIEIDGSDHDVLPDEIESDSDFETTRQGKRKSAPAGESISEPEEAEPAPKRRKLRGAAAGKKGVFGSRDGTENIEKTEAGVLPVKAKARSAKARTSIEGSGQLARITKKGELDDLPKDGRWTKHYGAVREKMGNLEPVHGEGRSPVDHILRVFDMSYEYGPCVGVTRLERWNRAEALGLNPPPEVKEILLTKAGSEDTRFTECVFHGEV